MIRDNDVITTRVPREQLQSRIKPSELLTQISSILPTWYKLDQCILRTSSKWHIFLRHCDFKTFPDKNLVTNQFAFAITMMHPIFTCLRPQQNALEQLFQSLLTFNLLIIKIDRLTNNRVAVLCLPHQVLRRQPIFRRDSFFLAALTELLCVPIFFSAVVAYCCRDCEIWNRSGQLCGLLRFPPCCCLRNPYSQWTVTGSRVTGATAKVDKQKFYRS